MNVPPENYKSNNSLFLNLIMVFREDITILLNNCKLVLTCAYNT